MQLRNHITDNTALFKIIKQKLNHDDRKPARHTRASIWVNSKANIYAVAKVLGHSDISMLHKCYAHSDVEQLRNLLDMQ